MWLNYIKQIEKISIKNDKEYIEQYSKLFSIQLYSINKTISLLTNSSNDLFPERKTFINCLNKGDNINLLLSLFYHWENIDLSWLFSSSSKPEIKQIFMESSDLFLYRTIGFSPDELLSKTMKDRTLIFLFLYYFPSSPSDILLYHYEKKIPLLCFNNVSIEHFHMLIFLMKKYDQYSFEKYCSNYNFNHLLIETFLDSTQELFNFKNDILWHKILPIDKIFRLLDLNCAFTNFAEYRNEKHFYTFENLPSILTSLEVTYFKEKLNLQLSKNKFNHKELIKI